MTLAEFHSLNDEEKKELLQRCCGSSAWVDKMLAAFPVEDLEDLFIKAENKWKDCKKEDWLEAFEHHPKIGDINSLKAKFANTAKWAEGEQSGVNETSQQVLEALAEGNKAYEDKFGYIFIVCATGKSAEEMLRILTLRLQNDPEDELRIAVAEQNKITKIRLEKLFA
ncbi:MAG TPA: 2-oxo-4-hydroxy-4-carboxy-5-ureidoimidazoline decarboxylase [Segetibacter sp.]|jgi:2-oxo-4-hydroxy-4-carboxy-5-ureidoimidazoline decarboxylase